MQFDGKPAPSSGFYTQGVVAKKGLEDRYKNDPGSHRESIEKFSQLSLLKQRLREWFNHSVEAGKFLRRQDSYFCQWKQAKSQWLQVKNRQNNTRVRNHQNNLLKDVVGSPSFEISTRKATNPL